jgi:hypothetical protein
MDGPWSGQRGVDRRSGQADDRAVPYSTRQYGSNARWLMKALREVAGEIESLLGGLGPKELRWRPGADAWSAREVIAFLAASEREDLRAISAMIDRDGARIEERRAHLVPDETDFETTPVRRLFSDFVTLREELLWTLQLAEDGWDHAGKHPYRGRVTLSQYVHEVNERDLEAMLQLRGIREALQMRRATRGGAAATTGR